MHVGERVRGRGLGGERSEEEWLREKVIAA